MKCLLLAVIVVTLNLASAEQSTTPDYRDKYDRLWLEWVNERIKEGERFLERLSVQLKEFQTKHDEPTRQRIETEVEMTLTSVKASMTRFETELKSPNLDLIERYVLEKAEAEGKVVVKLLTDVQKIVAKKP